MLHLHRGTPYVYQGEELGMTNHPFGGIDELRDIESLNHYAQAVGLGADPEHVMTSLRSRGRDNARTPVQWDDSAHAGFTTGEPWLPVNPNHDEVNAAAAIADEHSVFHHYRRLIELRHTVPVVAHGDFTMLLPDDEVVYAFTRSLDDVELLVAANFSGDPVQVERDAALDLDGWADAEVLLDNVEPGGAGVHGTARAVAGAGAAAYALRRCGQ